MVTFSHAVNIAMKQETLEDALAFICTWESDNVIRSFQKKYAQGKRDDSGSRESFKRAISIVIKRWKTKNPQEIKVIEKQKNYPPRKCKCGHTYRQHYFMEEFICRECEETIFKGTTCMRWLDDRFFP